jgi:predicted DNA-binding transcriptional regulator AlpA
MIRRRQVSDLAQGQHSELKHPGIPNNALGPVGLRELLNADDVAAWLRTSRRAVYVMLERGQLPTPIRLGRRLLWERVALDIWIEEKRVLSLTGSQR